MSCSCQGISVECTREGMFRQRLPEVLRALNCQFPSLFPQVDFWRPTVVSPIFDECGREKFIDDTPETWVRLGESITVFSYEKEDKFFQAGEGIIRMRIRWMLAPEGMGLQPGDHVIIGGKAFMIVDIASEMGVSRMKLDEPKSRFVKPARTAPTYRQLQIGANIA